MRERARMVPSIWTSYKWGSCETYPDLATVVLHVYKVCPSSDGREDTFLYDNFAIDPLFRLVLLREVLKKR